MAIVQRHHKHAESRWIKNVAYNICILNDGTETKYASLHYILT